MKSIAITISVISGLLIICIFLFIKSGGEVLNVDISSYNMLSAKDLVTAVKPYINKYWGNRSYYVGEITMSLDENYEGIVKLWFKDDMKNRNGVPHIITVEVDTKEKKILRIINNERNTKIVPGNIDIENWLLDSEDVIKMHKDIFSENKDSSFTSIWLSANDIYKGGIETWSCTYYNENTKKAYRAQIDAYTGEVYNKEVK